MLSDEEIASLGSDLSVDTEQIRDDLEKLHSYQVDAKKAVPTLRLKYSANEKTIFDIKGISTVRGHFLLAENYDGIEKIASENVSTLAEVKYLSEQIAEEIIESATKLQSDIVAKEVGKPSKKSSVDDSESTQIDVIIEQQVDAEASSTPFTAGESLVKDTPPAVRDDDHPGTCGFVFDPEAWPGNGDKQHRMNLDHFEDDVWRCPHHASEDEDYCIFHRSPEEKDNEETIRRFTEQIKQRSECRLEKQFIGARFSELDLSGEIVDPSDTYTIDLKHCAVLGETDLGGAQFKNAVDLSHSRLDGGLVLRDSTFEDMLKLYHCYVDSTIDGVGVYCSDKMQFSQAQCLYGVRFDSAEFENGASFTDTNFESYLTCNQAKFSGPANFFNTVFNYKAEFNAVTFEDQVRFCGAVFDLDEKRDYVPEFERSRFEDEAIFGDDDRYYAGSTTFEQCPDFSNAEFNESVTYNGTTFSKGANISETKFHHDVDFTDAEIGSTINGTNSQILGSIQLVPASTGGSRIIVDFHGASIHAGTFGQPQEGHCYYDCTDALLGDVLVTENDHRRFPLDYVRMVKTEFDAFDFVRYRVGLEQSNWKIHTFEGDPPVQSADIEAVDRELTYLRAKSGANQIGDGRAASEFFQHEMRSRRDRFQYQAKSAESLLAVIKARYKQFFNLGFDKVCHYGEGPVQTGKTMIGVIGIFALFYAGLFQFFGNGGPYPELEQTLAIEYALFSAESFITVIHNPTAHIDSIIIRALSVFQGFLGALFVALFLFTLTRYVHR